MCRRHLLVLEAEAPGIDQGSYGDVEGSVGLAVHLLCQLVDLVEHLAALGILAPVDGRDGRVLVEHRELVVHLLQLGLYLILQAAAVLVGGIIGGAEDEAGVLLKFEV